ncbi:hypothetical protein PTNB85_08941 [Pyrenophora teres f. teres]|nr:hypothetical protein HRS9139_10215 [Pyrenophora teres f. teres]KAE8825996.1 hypothetical protein PTNB85_08941 [Pyrenophora teres f. teres]KAE8832993.1 hypothetical protein HRS9122_08706 [Pyrenophora teres f. teres]
MTVTSTPHSSNDRGLFAFSVHLANTLVSGESNVSLHAHFLAIHICAFFPSEGCATRVFTITLEKFMHESKRSISYWPMRVVVVVVVIIVRSPLQVLKFPLPSPTIVTIGEHSIDNTFKCTKGPAKRARSVSISVKVNHDPMPLEPLKTPKIPAGPKNTQACLGGVPEELLLNILQKLRYSPRTLAKLCRTDRRCKRVAEEVLYNKVTAFDHEKARAIAATPRLALHVRSCNAEIIDDFYHPEYRKDRFTQVIAKAVNIHSLHVSDSSDWPGEHIEHDKHQSIGWLSLFHSAVQSGSGPVNRFAHLSNLKIASAHLSVEHIASVLSLPSLKVLELQHIHQTTPFVNWSIPDSSCSIQTLRLMNTMMDVTAVAHIISAMKALRNFTYLRDTLVWEPFGGEHSALSTWACHSWQLLGDALRKHHDSLETVMAWDSSDKDIIDIVYPDGHNYGTFGSFQAFSKLKHCGGPIEAFLDVAAGEADLSVYFPPTVSTFRITMSTDNSALWTPSLSALASLRDVVRDGTRRKVDLIWEGALPTPTLSLANPLEILKQTGIELRLTINSRTLTVEKLKELESKQKGSQTGSNYDQDEDAEESDREYSDAELAEEENEGERMWRTDYDDALTAEAADEFGSTSLFPYLAALESP